MPETADTSGLMAALQGNWQAEIQDCERYEALAARELNARKRNVLRGLAAAERYHAGLWAGRIHALAHAEGLYSGRPAQQAIRFRNAPGYLDVDLRRLRVDERQGIGRYKKQLSELVDGPSLAILREVIADENEHYKALSSLIRARPPLPNMDTAQAKQALGNLLAARKRRHPEAADWVNDAVYAANDGLGSIFGIVAGVAGATLGKGHFVLIAGLAGAVGNALSTGTGAYLSAKNERELFEAGVARERQAVEYDEAEAREVLELNYQIRGLPEDVAGRLVHLVAENKEDLIKALARTRANTSEEALSNPWVSALAGAAATAVGALIPILPFFFMAGVPAILVAAAVALIAHFCVGAAKSLMTVRSWWSSGLELTIFGVLEGITTYAIGMTLGHLVGMN